MCGGLYMTRVSPGASCFVLRQTGSCYLAQAGVSSLQSTQAWNLRSPCQSAGQLAIGVRHWPPSFSFDASVACAAQIPEMVG